MKEKRSQADRQVINLADTKVTPEQLRRWLNGNPISGLKEVIAVDKSNRVRQVYP